MNSEEENFKYKYLKYKLKYLNLHGAGPPHSNPSSASLEETKSATSEVVSPPLSESDFREKVRPELRLHRTKFDKYFQFFSQFNKETLKKYCRTLEDESAKRPDENIGRGTTSQVFKYTFNGEEISASVQEKPTFDIDEIKLLIKLNEYKDKDKGTPCFSQFKYVLFDIFYLKYYICYELYTGDLKKYLIFLFEQPQNEMESILRKIETKLNNNFAELLNSPYLCLDIKLGNILVKHNKNEFEELVLHDYDFSACCIKDTQYCESTNEVKNFLLLYYKLNIFMTCNYLAVANGYDGISRLYENEFNNDNIIDDLRKLFEYILNTSKIEVGITETELDTTPEEGLTIYDYYKTYIVEYAKLNKTVNYDTEYNNFDYLSNLIIKIAKKELKLTRRGNIYSWVDSDTQQIT